MSRLILYESIGRFNRISNVSIFVGFVLIIIGILKEPNFGKYALQKILLANQYTDLNSICQIRNLGMPNQLCKAHFVIVSKALAF